MTLFLNSFLYLNHLILAYITLFPPNPHFTCSHLALDHSLLIVCQPSSMVFYLLSWVVFSILFILFVWANIKWMEFLWALLFAFLLLPFSSWLLTFLPSFHFTWALTYPITSKYLFPTPPDFLVLNILFIYCYVTYCWIKMVITLRFRPKNSPISRLWQLSIRNQPRDTYVFYKLPVYTVKSTKTTEIVNSLNLNVILNLNTKNIF